MVYVASSTDLVVRQANEAIQGPLVETVLHGVFDCRSLFVFLVFGPCDLKPAHTLSPGSF